jgi:uncharacterized membrane protein YeaQ/YmgE (transglycosylase-associated protein family)
MSAVIRTSTAPSAAPSHSQPLAIGDVARAIAFDARGDITLETFLSEVRGLAATLPDARHAINLCDDRYRFLVAFCAVALRGQTTLLPPSRAPATIGCVQQQHPDSYCIGDMAISPMPPHYLRMPDTLPRIDGPLPHVDGAALVAIGFTSGSTGLPRANPKTWDSFRTSTAQNLAALQDLWPHGVTPHIVATVPPQHMYGMELSVLFPLLGGAAVHGARPFFPADIAASLGDASRHRVLVTTPVHLRALVESGIDLPPLEAIVTATAPLSQALAASAEARFGCEVREVFGSTETCVIARRRTAIEELWTPLPGVRVQPQPDGTLVHAAHLPAPVVLADLVEVDADGRFLLCGRQADLLEIAGKRASLGELTRCLLAIPGVEDGVVLQMDECDAGGMGEGSGASTRRTSRVPCATASIRCSCRVACNASLHCRATTPASCHAPNCCVCCRATCNRPGIAIEADVPGRPHPGSRSQLTRPSHMARQTWLRPYAGERLQPFRFIRGVPSMGIIIWLIVGGIVGWLASMIMKTDGQQGILLNIVVGIVGAFIGGWLIGPLVGAGSINDGFSVMSLVVSLIGAIILLAIVNLFRRGRVR